jgi:methylated-DNA-protein-cysteine methyltransferase-like protein
LFSIVHDIIFLMSVIVESIVYERNGKPCMSKFFEQVYAVVEQIPYGKVISYGQIARILGRPRAAREVGWAMRHCPEHLPWQRVVMSDGSITGGMYADIRKARLEAEGAVFLQDGRVDMQLCNMQTTIDISFLGGLTCQQQRNL